MIKYEKKLWWHYAKGSLGIYGINALFGIFSAFLLVDGIPNGVKLFLPIIFFVPSLLFTFMGAKTCGTNAYNVSMKLVSNKPLQEDSIEGQTAYDFKKGFYYTLAFSVPIFLLLILSVLFKNLYMRAVVVFIFMPYTIIFSSLGIINVSSINWVATLFYLIPLAITIASYIIGYYVGYRKCRQIHLDIENELRFYGND